MKLRVYASTKPGYTLPTDEALKMAGIEAGICYMPDDFDALLAEPEARTMRRVRGTIGSGHHSVAGHPSYCLILEGLPKIIAMLLNNEQDYNTSEKSARYTIMNALYSEQPTPDGDEKTIYEKWTVIFDNLIAKKYPEIPAKTRKKLALENARYFISVFTPATTMGYTADLRQINYLIGFAEQLYQMPTVDPFLLKLRPWVLELAKLLRSVCNVDGLRDNKGRRFSLFGTRVRRELFDESYSMNYVGTFSQLAQAHRHRSIYYEMLIPQLDSCEFYVPPIIEDEALREEYLKDMESLKDNYPQGMLIHINERSIVEKFIGKCQERLCGAAQREICMQTENNLERYITGTILSGNVDVYMQLVELRGKTKCQLGYYVCDRPCPLGPAHAFDRLI